MKKQTIKHDDRNLIPISDLDEEDVLPTIFVFPKVIKEVPTNQKTENLGYR